jgi:hypothetical protein
MRAFMLTLGKSGPPPEQIGEAVLRALTAAKPKVRLGTSAPSTRLRKTEIQPLNAPACLGCVRFRGRADDICSR